MLPEFLLSVKSNTMHDMKILRMNTNDDYNNNTNIIDISGPIFNQYRIDHCMNKYKRQWSLFFWSRGVLVVNKYVIFKK